MKEYLERIVGCRRVILRLLSEALEEQSILCSEQEFEFTEASSRPYRLDIQRANIELAEAEIELWKYLNGGVPRFETVVEKKTPFTDAESGPVLLTADTHALAEAFAMRICSLPGGAFPDAVQETLRDYVRRSPPYGK
jgi:hypothetical protein